MSLSAGNIVSWSDIQSIYNNLNTAKTYLSQTQVTVPSNPGLTVPSTVQSLKDSIESCKSNSYVNAAGSYLTNVTTPGTGTLLYPGIFEQMNDTINKIKNTCLHNSAHFTSNHGFGSNSSNNGFGSNGNHGFGSNGNDTFHSARSGNGSQSVANSFST